MARTRVPHSRYCKTRQARREWTIHAQQHTWYQEEIRVALCILRILRIHTHMPQTAPCGKQHEHVSTPDNRTAGNVLRWKSGRDHEIDRCWTHAPRGINKKPAAQTHFSEPFRTGTPRSTAVDLVRHKPVLRGFSVRPTRR